MEKDIKEKVQGLDPNTQPRDLGALIKDSSNIYETLNVISNRSRQLAVNLKHELHGKLEEFAVNTETIEEITENKEQIEISKFYERLPNPVIIAMDEFLSDDLYYDFRKNKGKNQEG